MAELVESPYPAFLDIDGTPLEDGFIFIGEPGLDPETNPLQAYWDLALTDPADNIRTKSGYPFNGTFPSRLYTATPFSILVKNKREEIVYEQQDGFVPSAGDASSLSGATLSTDGTLASDSDTLIPSEKASKTYIDTEDAATLATIDAAFVQNLAHPIGEIYIQYPNMAAPMTLYPSQTWGNVSSSFAGDFFRAEGGKASAFESGQQLDAGQRITGAFANQAEHISASGAFTQAAVGGFSSAASGVTVGFTFDSADSVSPNTAKTDDDETRAVNQTIRIWERTA